MSQRRKDETLSTSAEHVGRTIAPVAELPASVEEPETRERQSGEPDARGSQSGSREQIGETIEAAFPDRAAGVYRNLGCQCSA